jgi:hypothetical protein
MRGILFALAILLAGMGVANAQHAAVSQEAASEQLASPQVLDPVDSLPTDEYGNCPDPVFVCSYFHANATLSAYCAYAETFKKTDFEAATVQAVDDEGLFPRTFMSRDMQGLPYNAWSSEPCVLVAKRNVAAKWTIPEPNIRCGAGMITPDAIYYWHFASNPATGCLGIVECKESVSGAPIVSVPAP